MGKKILVATGGGDCPGLNAVIRGIVKRASQEPGWEVWGCMESFNGLLKDQIDIRRLTDNDVAGKTCIITHHNIIPDDTIVRHMGPHQKAIPRTDGGYFIIHI